MKILLIGTDLPTSEMAVLSLRLRWPEARAVIATKGAEGVDMVERELPDVVILQPNFTDMSLSEAIEEIRRFSEIPLLVLWRENGEAEAVKALEVGADDYIRSPYGFVELVARVMAVMRRVQRGDLLQSPESPIVSGSLTINPATYEVHLDGQHISMTPTEFKLLYLLSKNRGAVVHHRLLEQALWGDRVESASLVKKYVQRVRKKLSDNPGHPQWIASVHGTGYRFIGPREGVPEGERAHPLTVPGKQTALV
ncbi:MAG: response regulator transcription factor [Chloroflexota bacterium]